MKNLLIAAGAIFGLILLVNIIAAYAGGRVSVGRGQNFHLGLLSPLLLIGGYIVSSRAFIEMHSRVKSHDWFMLPASNSEKFLSKWLLTSFVYAIAIICLYFVFSLVSGGIGALLTHQKLVVFNPFSKNVLLLLLHYGVTQSIWLLGAAFFRKNNFLKTFLSMMGVLFVLGVLAAVIFRIVYWDYFDGFAPSSRFEMFFEQFQGWNPSAKLEGAQRTIYVLSQVFYWGILGPLCLTIAFFRIKEAEIKNGI